MMGLPKSGGKKSGFNQGMGLVGMGTEALYSPLGAPSQAMGMLGALGGRRQRINYVTDWNMMADKSSADQAGNQSLGLGKGSALGTRGVYDQNGGLGMGDPMQSSIARRRQRLGMVTGGGDMSGGIK